MRCAVRFAGALVGLVGASACLTAGCGDSASPGGGGDTLVDDTRPQPRPPQTPDDGADAAPDAAYANEAGYPQLGACDTCTCAPAQGYCFAGATRRARTLSTEAGARPACTMAPGDGLTPAIGCNPIPSGCADCACVLAAVQPGYACYLVCADDGAQLTVYCPHP